MARPVKKGIDYFPLDVDVFENDKLFDVQSEFGPLGEVVYFRLLCLIYRKGYYFKFDSFEKLASIVVRSIGFRWADDRNVIVEIIKYLIKCRLFDSTLAEKNILTSRGIQERYKLATEKRKSGISEYSLLGGEVSTLENESFRDGNPTNKSKEKESKKNKIIHLTEVDTSVCACDEEHSPCEDMSVYRDDNTDYWCDEEQAQCEGVSVNQTETSGCAYDDEQAVADMFNDICRSLPKVLSLNSKRRHNIRRADKLIDGRFEEFFRRIENSDFLTGRVGSWSGGSFDWVLKPDNIMKILEGNYDNREKLVGNDHFTESDMEFLKTLGTVY